MLIIFHPKISIAKWYLSQQITDIKYWIVYTCSFGTSRAHNNSHTGIKHIVCCVNSHLIVSLLLKPLQLLSYGFSTYGPSRLKIALVLDTSYFEL